MSKDIKDITQNIMSQINEGKIKMRPKIYFVLGSILTFTGLIFSIVVSVFLIGIVRFSLRTHGPMGEYRLNQILSSFPWWALVFAVLGLVLGIWLIRKYDFSIKLDLKIISVIFVLSVILGGVVIDAIGINDVLIRKGPMRGMMRKYLDSGDNMQNIQFGKWRSFDFKNN